MPMQLFVVYFRERHCYPPHHGACVRAHRLPQGKTEGLI